MRVLLAGGGTAGHINPALSIADTIKKHKPDSEFLFVGTKHGMESRLVPKSGYKIEFVEIQGLKRKISVSNIQTVIKTISACFACRKIIQNFNPDVVIGTGGYVSGPLLYMASAMKIPTLIHEQNVFAGMTSKILSAKVDTVCISFEKSRDRFKKAKNIVLTGNPIRNKLFDITKTEARKKLGVDDKPLLVSFGGSLGAQKINDTMIDFIKQCDEKKINIIFATGENGFSYVSEKLKGINKKGVNVVKYIYNMDEVMQAADLLVCRAGAITVSEINALGKPSVLIPSPNVTDNHQFYNAKALADNNAAILIEEKNLNNNVFRETVNSLLNDEAKLIDMGCCSYKMGIKNATSLIYDEIMKLVNGVKK